MSRRLIKNYADHQKLRAMIDEETFPLVLSPAAGALPGGTHAVAYTTTITVTNPVGPAAFVISAGALPAGLTLNSTTGVIAGTVAAAGSSSFTVSAVDEFGNVGSAAYTLAMA